MEFDYNQETIILLKEFDNQKVGSELNVSKDEAKKLVKAKTAYLANSFHFDWKIKVGLLLTIFFSTLVIMSLNILLLLDISSMLSLFLIIELFYVLIGSFALFMLTKMNRLTKKQLLLLGSFTIIALPFFWNGEIIFKDTNNGHSKESTSKK